MSMFVDTSVWFAAVAKKDVSNSIAKSILLSTPDHVMTDQVLAETWLLLKIRFGQNIAETFWNRLRESSVRIEPVSAVDLEAAWATGAAFPKQNFSLIDRTSFAAMERLGITKVATFNDDFAAFRYGRARDKSFEIVRSGHSAEFKVFKEAIMNRKPLTISYKGGAPWQVCPYILGHALGEERASVLVVGSTGKRNPTSHWSCLSLSKVKVIGFAALPWNVADYPGKVQRCVDHVYLHVDEQVPRQPGRDARLQ